MNSMERTIASNFRALAKIPKRIDDIAIWEAIEQTNLMVFNPEDQVSVLRRALGLSSRPAPAAR